MTWLGQKQTKQAYGAIHLDTTKSVQWLCGTATMAKLILDFIYFFLYLFFYFYNFGKPQNLCDIFYYLKHASKSKATQQKQQTSQMPMLLATLLESHIPY